MFKRKRRIHDNRYYILHFTLTHYFLYILESVKSVSNPANAVRGRILFVGDIRVIYTMIAFILFKSCKSNQRLIIEDIVPIAYFRKFVFQDYYELKLELK